MQYPQYRPTPYPHPSIININNQQPSPNKNLMYGGNIILRNGSNSYRPLTAPDNTYLPQQKAPKFKPLQRTLDNGTMGSGLTENPDRIKSLYQ